VKIVAILMTLEGEYYVKTCHAKALMASRNPHDIGRRILHDLLIMKGCNDKCRNPHDIGRRILQEKVIVSPLLLKKVAILMTLEGEYYRTTTRSTKKNATSRNPHDIGRRILHCEFARTPEMLGVAILMTLEGEYYPIIST